MRKVGYGKYRLFCSQPSGLFSDSGDRCKPGRFIAILQCFGNSTAMLAVFDNLCQKSHAMLQFFVNPAPRGLFLPKISRNAAIFRQNSGLRRPSAENLTHCCNFSASPVKNVEHCGSSLSDGGSLSAGGSLPDGSSPSDISVFRQMPTTNGRPDPGRQPCRQVTAGRS